MPRSSSEARPPKQPHTLQMRMLFFWTASSASKSDPDVR
jgi:hypothetical protein